MKYKAVVSFSGTISMAEGEIAEIADGAVSADLLRAGYIVAVEEPKHESKRNKAKSNL
jgi:hypothetical protein